MNTDFLKQPSVEDIRLAVRDRVRARRKEHKLTQAQLAQKSDVSLGSLRRFESTGEIALTSLIKIAVALNCEDDFTHLFAQKHYRSIEDVIAFQKKPQKSSTTKPLTI